MDASPPLAARNTRYVAISPLPCGRFRPGGEYRSDAYGVLVGPHWPGKRRMIGPHFARRLAFGGPVFRAPTTDTLRRVRLQTRCLARPAPAREVPAVGGRRAAWRAGACAGCR